MVKNPMFPAVDKDSYLSMVKVLRNRYTVVALRGEAGCGKDTLAEVLTGDSIPFNQYMYDVFSALTGISAESLNNQGRKAEFYPDSSVVFRDAIINFIDGVEREHPTFKEFLLQQVFYRLSAGGSNVLIIPSVRRPIELEILEELGAKLVTITRPDMPRKKDVRKTHITEQINDYPYEGAELILTVGEGKTHINYAAAELLRFMGLATTGKHEYSTTSELVT